MNTDPFLSFPRPHPLVVGSQGDENQDGQHVLHSVALHQRCSHHLQEVLRVIQTEGDCHDQLCRAQTMQTQSQEGCEDPSSVHVSSPSSPSLFLPPLCFCPLSILPPVLSLPVTLCSSPDNARHTCQYTFSLYTSSSLLIALCHWLLIIEKFKPSAHCACAVPLIDGLGQEYAFTRGIYASSSQRV